MSKPPLENGQFACDQIRERLQALFPDMTFRVSPHDGTRPFRMVLPGTIRIFGQRTRNMRYDRANSYAVFDVSAEDYIAADAGSGTDPLLQAVAADLQAQLRMRNQ